ncbi:MAG: TlpA disulfide reductase family protein [Rikenellaceae bacterium]
MHKINIRYNVAAASVAMVFATLLIGCQSSSMKISGRFVGGDSSVAYLEELTSFEGAIIDSAVLNSNGEFIFNIKAKDHHHRLYNIVYDWSTIPVFAAPGDHVKLNSVGNIAKNYTVEGSEESEKIRDFYQKYIVGIAALDKIAMEYGRQDISDDRREELVVEYSAQHNQIKREQLEFIITNKASLAAVYALYQRLPNDSYLFNGRSDAIYYRTVAEALAENYPDSPYLKSVEAQIADFDAYNSLVDNIEVRGYPDLELADVFGTKQNLSSLDGKVILLDFWSAQLGGSNRNNAELKEVYADLKEQGFEIYQVAIDSSKSTWINAVHEQSLPWISVSDLKGNRSQVLTTYNITALPTNFLISRQGEIVARDLHGDELESRIKAELAK